MAWNEPGGNNQDPWRGGNRSGQDGPPDLDEVLKKLKNRFTDMLGKSSKQNSGGGFNGSGDNDGEGFSLSGKMLGGIFIVLVAIWCATGIYIVGPAENGVVTRFGAYHEISEPGPHWHLPYPIDSVQIVNVGEITSIRQKASMLTQDENIVEVELTVQAQIGDPKAFLFQDNNPRHTLEDATLSVLRVTIGQSKLDFVLTEGRGRVSAAIKEQLQQLMNEYHTGMIITAVNMLPAQPPAQVKDAFDDAIKSREDKEKLENQAQAYANEVVPLARGQAAKITAAAQGYRESRIAEAEGETSRFLSMLAEYQKAPEVTRNRLYIETMQSVLQKNHKVLMDANKGTNSMFYIPLDKMLNTSKTNTQGQQNDVAKLPDVEQTPARVQPQPVEPPRTIRTERGLR